MKDQVTNRMFIPPTQDPKVTRAPRDREKGTVRMVVPKTDSLSIEVKESIDSLLGHGEFDIAYVTENAGKLLEDARKKYSPAGIIYLEQRMDEWYGI